MMAGSMGDAAQTRAIVDQAAKATVTLAISEFVAQHPELRKAEIPSPLKWAGGIIAALLATGIGGTAVWGMTTLNEMQVTVARIDERMSASGVAQSDRDDDQDRRIGRLEQYHEGARQ